MSVCTTATAPYLPVEIIEQILRYSDGRSLCCAAKVCSTWYSIVRKLQRCQGLWRNICKSELSIEDVSEVVSQVYPASRLREVWSDQDIDWFIIFKINHSHKLVGQNKCQPEKLRSFDAYDKQEVNCVQVTGDCVVTGHDDGSVNVWTYEGDFLELLATHLRAVTDLALLSYFKTCPPWNIGHQYVISTSGDHTIQINPICPASMVQNNRKIILQVHACPTMLVRSHDDNFIVISEDAGVSIWSTEPPSQPFELPRVTLVTFTINYTWQRLLCSNFIAGRLPGEIISMTANCVTLSGRHLKVDVCLGEEDADSNLYWTLQLGKEPVVCEPARDLATSLTILQCAVWRNQLFVLISGSHTLCISLDGELYKEHDVSESLRGNPTSVLLAKNLLFLGLDCGEVVIYYFATPSELLQLDTLPIHHRLTLPMPQGPSLGPHSAVQHLGLSVRGDVTTLLAATSRHMYLATLT